MALTMPQDQSVELSLNKENDHIDEPVVHGCDVALEGSVELTAAGRASCEKELGPALWMQAQLKPSCITEGSSGRSSRVGPRGGMVLLLYTNVEVLRLSLLKAPWLLSLLPGTTLLP